MPLFFYASTIELSMLEFLHLLPWHLHLLIPLPPNSLFLTFRGLRDGARANQLTQVQAQHVSVFVFPNLMVEFILTHLTCTPDFEICPKMRLFHTFLCPILPQFLLQLGRFGVGRPRTVIGINIFCFPEKRIICLPGVAVTALEFMHQSMFSFGVAAELVIKPCRNS